MKRKISLLTAAFMIMYSLCAFGASFSDMPGEESEYYKAIQFAVDNNIINGDGDKIMPSSPVTRAQAAVMLSRALGLTEKADISAVTDVSEGDWYSDAFACTVRKGIFTVSGGKLFPDSVLDRRSAAFLAYDAFNTSSSADYSALFPIADPTAAVTRADFLLWIYNYANPSSAPTEASSETASEASSNPTQASSEASSEAATEAVTEASSTPTVSSEYQKKAEEARQLALGILSDGTSYLPTLPVYRDGNSSALLIGMVTGSYSSGGSSSRPTSPTSAPTSPTSPTSAPTSPTSPTSAPTEAPTESPAPTEAPTYNGPISNDKDNIVEDPFDDGWTSDGDGEGDIGFDDEDIFPTEPSTSAGEKPSEEPSSEPSSESSSEPSSEPGSEPGDEPSSESSSEPGSEPGDEPSEDSSGEPSEEPGDAGADGDSGETSPSESGSEEAVLLAALKKERWFV